MLPEPARQPGVDARSQTRGQLPPDEVPPSLRAAVRPEPRRAAARPRRVESLARRPRPSSVRGRSGGRARADAVPERIDGAAEGRAVRRRRSTRSRSLALSYLLRPDDWAGVVDRARVRRCGERAEERVGAGARRDRRAAAGPVEQAEQAQRELRASHRVQVATAARRRSARCAAGCGGSPTAACGAPRARSRSCATPSPPARRRRPSRGRPLKEVRRLRGTVAALEGWPRAVVRRARRRTRRRCAPGCCWRRLLDAAGGLQRELGLPPSSGSPATGWRPRWRRRGSGRGGRPGAAAVTPGRLAQYLAMPRARLLVDGYNVTKTVWPTPRLEVQRSRLLDPAGRARGAHRRGDHGRLRRRRHPRSVARAARRAGGVQPRRA